MAGESTDDTPQQLTAEICGHGHGALIELPKYGDRCPACFPALFIEAMGAAWRDIEYLLALVNRIPVDAWPTTGESNVRRVDSIARHYGWDEDG